MKPDFSGYATRNDLRCSDGRTIKANAFSKNDKGTVPLVWQHQHNDPTNILGHAQLENRDDGVYAYGFFNDSQAAKHAKESITHGDIKGLSIYANQLVQKGGDVLHGEIREVSLVISGANPGAFIDNISIRHGDEVTRLEDEAVIYTGLELHHSEEPALQHADEDSDSDDSEDKSENKSDDDETVKDVFDGMTEEQKNVVYFMIGTALEEKEGGDSKSESDSAEHSESNAEANSMTHQEGDNMTRNVFEQNGATQATAPSLSHDQLKTIMADADRIGSLKESFLAHAVDYGIENIDLLFPDAKTIRNAPDFVKRRTEWVSGVINGTHHTPFSRIKSLSADITHDEARAKGYIKGTMKKEEFFGLAKRVTTPTTIYKKQKLDRDDIIDITDLDVVAWLKAEMRVMLDEEIARAILLGDGREVDDEDKIPENFIRPVAKDDDFYTHRVDLPANAYGTSLIDAILRNRRHYKGTGTPTLYTTEDVLTDLLLLKDKLGRRLYETTESLNAALRVSSIQVVDVMEDTPELIGILVNLSDYTVGTDKGGQVSMFDDFDIDFNQYKYLIEGRLSGALTLPKSAQAFFRADGTEVVATQPSFNEGTNALTIPSVTGVQYLVNGEAKTGSVTITEDVLVEAVAQEGYYIKANTPRDWEFTYTE